MLCDARFAFCAGAPELAIAEMLRVVRPGGIVAATVWDTFAACPARLFWDTFAAIEPTALVRRGLAVVRPMTFPGEMTRGFAAAGLENITEVTRLFEWISRISTITVPLINGQGTLAAFLATLPQGVPERVQGAVRQAYLSDQADGPRSFASAAWAVKGTVPTR